MKLLSIVHKCLIFLLFYGYTISSSFCQTSDTAVLAARITYVKNLYKFTAAEQLPLYTGAIYREYSSEVNGHPFFQTGEWQPGSVIFDDELYEDVQLKYDIYKNELVIRNFNDQPVWLIPSRIKGFSIGSQKFVIFPNEFSSTKSNSLFYEQLYSGKIQVLAKHTKLIEKTLGDTVEEEYYSRTTFYILKENYFHEIRNNSAILKVFKDKKRELRDFIRKKNIDFKAHPEKALAELSQQYEILTFNL